jgi:hypothetical protein
MTPLRGLALAQPDHTPRPHLEGVRLQGHHDHQPPILGGGPRTVLRGRGPAGGARLPIEAPGGHRRRARGVRRRHQFPQLRPGETGSIASRCGAGLEIGNPPRSHGGGLLSSEAQDTTNRD